MIFLLEVALRLIHASLALVLSLCGVRDGVKVLAVVSLVDAVVVASVAATRRRRVAALVVLLSATYAAMAWTKPSHAELSVLLFCAAALPAVEAEYERKNTVFNVTTLKLTADDVRLSTQNTLPVLP